MSKLYMITLKQNKLYKDVQTYFKKRGVNVFLYDEVIGDTFLASTEKSKDELVNMMYVDSVKKISDGESLGTNMTIYGKLISSNELNVEEIKP